MRLQTPCWCYSSLLGTDILLEQMVVMGQHHSLFPLKTWPFWDSRPLWGIFLKNSIQTVRERNVIPRPVPVYSWSLYLLTAIFFSDFPPVSKGHLYPSHTSMGHCIIQNTPSICSLIWLPPFTSTVLMCKELPGEGRGFYKYRVPSLFLPSLLMGWHLLTATARFWCRCGVDITVKGY